MLKHIPFYGSLLNRPISETVKATKSHILLYGAIDVHDTGVHGCIASNKTLSEETGVSINHIRKYLSELKKANWISYEIDDVGKRSPIKPLLELQIPNAPPVQKLYTPRTKTVHPPYKNGTHRYNIDTVLDTSNTTSEEPAKTSFAEDENTKKLNKEIGEVIKAFEVVNPTCKNYYNNKTQRKACQDLIELYSFEKVLKVIGILDKIKATPYMPTITTPTQLNQKWSALESAMLRLKNKQESSVTQIV